MINSRWAVLLCKFSDDDSEPYSRRRFEEIFTSAGAGKWNMVDYFRDMSHGKLDLSGSKVFGWYTLDKKRSEYIGSGANPQGRRNLIDWARQKAIDNGVDLSQFFSVVVCLNVDTDLFGGGSGVVTSDNGSNQGLSGLSPSLLGQEMGHAYGLDHSREEGSSDDYKDWWDAMSTASTPYMAPHPVYTERDPRGDPVFRIGPGLNAANMWGRGWLDDARVWTGPTGAMNATMQIRPLHRRDLPGYLAIRFQNYFVEFRTNDGWDAAVNPAVLIHYFEDNHSYIVADNNGRQGFGAGSYFGTPKELSVFGSYFGIHVDSIDTAQQIATVRLINIPPKIPREWPKRGPYRIPEVAWETLGGRDDALVVLNRQAVRISRHSPTFRLLEQIARFETSVDFAATQDIVQRDAIANISSLAHELQAVSMVRAPSLPEPTEER